MSRTAEIFALSTLVTTSFTFHAGMRPFSVFSGDAVVHHSRVRIVMNPASPVNVTRKPRRAPRLVPSST
jgi:hypothetical protein